jgi:CRISPR-associated protein Cas2
MSQYSVYYRLLSGKEALDRYIKDIQAQLPRKGRVDIITITDKQYEGIVSFSGRINKTHRNSCFFDALFLQTIPANSLLHKKLAGI